LVTETQLKLTYIISLKNILLSWIISTLCY